jgi:glycogen operon protein
MSRLDPGRPGPLGAHWDGGGVNVAVWSRHAARIELCVFDPAGLRETARFELPGRTGDVRHGRLPGAGPGLIYGLRAHGPYAPREGHRFNPNKLLLDPYARELVGAFTWDDAVLGYQAGHPDGCDSFDPRDSAPFVPRARVAAPVAPAADRLPRPGRPWGETVLYELHVRGFSARHPDVPPAMRGTIEGLAHPAAIAHLQRLGVTAVELLPVAAWLDELHLVRRGLVNYWGYNPIAFFAMQAALAGPRGIAAMVDAVERMHAAGIEVILDVVFNHTGEGDERGPTLSLRGLDNASYYLPDPHRPGGYRNLTGCGNTLAAHEPAVGALIVDALRYWAGEVGVDGFRFDLASAIARDAHGRFDAGLPWIRALREDPVLARCKMVAEGWDCEGHFVGRFPPGWSEWNDRSRDDMRRFWRGDRGLAGALATRLAGSSDLFGHSGRTPAASINFLTAHDGFTLVDLVSYSRRHNLANGEDGSDGASDNHSDGCGAEGPTDDADVLRRRTRRMRAMLATLMLSRGVPMLRAGDELGATQDGNNNAYCQDGPLTWLQWPAQDADDADAQAAAGPPTPQPIDLRPLVASLARLRAALPCLRAERFFEGRRAWAPDAVPDVAWLRADGAPMGDGDWHDGGHRVLAMVLDAGRPRPDAPHDRVWIAFVADEGRTILRLPRSVHDGGWMRVLDTAQPDCALGVDAHDRVAIEGPSVVVCVAGAAAAAERVRWRPGLAPASFMQAGDASAAIEFVLDAPTTDAAGAATYPVLELVRMPTPLRADAPRRFVPGRDTTVVESRTIEGRRLERHRLSPCEAGGPSTGLVALRPAGARPAPYAADAPGGLGGPGIGSPGAAAATGRDAQAPQAAPPAPPDPRLYVAPPRCWLPEPIARPQGAWALSVQLYGLHGADSWGIGDFADLGALGEMAGALGASGLLVSPLHAPSLGWPDRGSPYSPSSRLGLNPLFVSLPRAAGLFATPLFDAWRARPDTRAAIAAARATPQVDYPSVVALKRTGFERLWSDFRATRDTAATREAARDFAAWRTAAMLRLRPQVLFEALADHHGVADRRAWPAGFEHPGTAAVRAFEREHADRVAFHAFVQWLAARQWREAGDRARAAGASIGPIADLAVGADAAGADSWSQRGLLADDFELGAPPDAFAADGQAWGLPAWRPDALAQAGHAPFAELLAATMDGAGGLRIDHVMALERLFWVPRGGRAADGAYVAYPLDELLRVVAAQSALNRCLVIGEDLGTVRDGLRERLTATGILSYRVAWFERAPDGTLADPSTLPSLAAVCASTHDLPTVDGWALGLDIDEREAGGALDAGIAARLREERAADLLRLEAGLARDGITGEDLTERLHRWLAVSRARLAIVQLEDVAGLARQPNLPGTPDCAPNWRQRLPLPLETLAQAPRWRALAGIFSARHAGTIR